MTEIVEGEVNPGDKLITGVVRGAVMGAGKAGGGSPFMPKPPQRRNENRAKESQRAKNAAARGM